MERKELNRLPGLASWWFALGVAFCAVILGAAPAGAATRADRPAASLVHGWNAGPVARGTGFRAADGSSRVREVQRRLDRLGYSPGPVDGLFGPLTDNAVRRYQSGRELTVDGVVGSSTLGSLRARTEAVRENTTGARPSRTQTEAKNSAGAASAPARPQVGKPVSATDGLEGLPSWWMLALIVPVAFSAAVLAALLMMRVFTLGQAATAGIHRRVLRRRDPDWGDHPAAGAVFVEGHSRDPRVGHFSGVAYWMWPVGANGDGAKEPSLLVYDPSKQAPVPVRREELTAVNGQALDPPVAQARRSSSPFKWVGARVLLAEQDGAVNSLPGTLALDLVVFAEGERRRCETRRVNRRPLHVRIDDLQASIQRAVISDHLPALVTALEERGVHMDAEALQGLPFAVELDVDVEFALAGWEVAQAQAG